MISLHGLLLWGLWNTDFQATMAGAGTLFVSLIDQHETKPEPPRPKVPVKLERPRPQPVKEQQLVAAVMATEPTDYAAPPPPPVITAPEPIGAPPGPPAPAAPQPVRLPELSLACPERTPPSYPAQARRMGEQGLVMLRVHLDEHGHVTEIVINKSSGSPRLDDAATQAVKHWQCNPATRDGHPVPAVALQPFNFVLDRS